MEAGNAESGNLEKALVEISELREQLKTESDQPKEFTDRVSILGSEIAEAIQERFGEKRAANFREAVARNRLNVYAALGRGILRADEALMKELKFYRREIKALQEEGASTE